MRVLCKTCNIEMARKKVLAGRKYCSAECYHYAKKHRKPDKEFTPDDFIVIEDYDEFLNHKKLPCLLKECKWSGVSICLHMRMAHGLNKREIKKLSGFNLHQSLITPKLRNTFENRDHSLKPGMNPEWRKDVTTLDKGERIYTKQGKQSAKIAKFQFAENTEPFIKSCHICKSSFEATPMGNPWNRKYCSKKCSIIAQKKII